MEHNLVCLNSHDHLTVFNFPQLKIQLRINNLNVASRYFVYASLEFDALRAIFKDISEPLMCFYKCFYFIKM